MSANARVFKTKWFSKQARRHLIGDEELCRAMAAVRLGYADDLGGGVFKKASAAESRSRHHFGERREKLDLYFPIRQTRPD